MIVVGGNHHDHCNMQREIFEDTDPWRLVRERKVYIRSFVLNRSRCQLTHDRHDHDEYANEYSIFSP